MSLLPGMHPGHAAAPHTISFFASSTSTGTTITAPSNIRAGDLIVMLDCIRNTKGVNGGFVTPTSFTLIDQQQGSLGTTCRQVLSYKVAAGTEGGTSITGMASSGTSPTTRKIMAVFRRSANAAGAVAGDATGEATDGDPSSQTVNVSGLSSPLVVLGAFSANAAISPRTMTKTGEISNESGANNIWLAYRLFNISPVDTTVDMDAEGTISNVLQSCYIRMT